jgi:hypothetical protein
MDMVDTMIRISGRVWGSVLSAAAKTNNIWLMEFYVSETRPSRDIRGPKKGQIDGLDSENRKLKCQRHWSTALFFASREGHMEAVNACLKLGKRYLTKHDIKSALKSYTAMGIRNNGFSPEYALIIRTLSTIVHPRKIKAFNKKSNLPAYSKRSGPLKTRSRIHADLKGVKRFVAFGSMGVC